MYKVVLKTIPVDLDPDFAPQVENGKYIYNEEILVEDKNLEVAYYKGRVRVIIFMPDEITYLDKPIENKDYVDVYVYCYTDENSWSAWVFDSTLSEINAFGGLPEFLEEIITGKNQYFEDRGSTVSM